MSYVVQLLGWVALQAAWQTLAVAIVLTVSLRLLAGVSASLRYRYAALHLVSAAGAFVLSLIVSHASVALTPLHASLSDVQPSGLPGLHDRIRPFLPAVTWIWLGGMAIAQALLAVRLIRLRRFLRKTTPATRAIVAVVESISFEIGLNRPPEVRCADIRSPMVAGQWPAVLILPRAFSKTHSHAGMRALLAHELAHVLRRDYSRNVLQLLGASLLWWHPAVWFIYGRIKHERECASDEHAFRLTGSALPLANALIRLADASMPLESILIGAHSSGLGDRISRLSESPACRTRKTTPLFSVVALAALTAIVVAESLTAPRGDALTRAYAASAAAPAVLTAIHAHDPAGTFRVEMIRGQVVAIELGQQPVPSDRVVQRGDTVRVLGIAGQELLRLEVDPRGGFRWDARPAPSESLLD